MRVAVEGELTTEAAFPVPGELVVLAAVVMDTLPVLQILAAAAAEVLGPVIFRANRAGPEL
jgi:hypothetical protein